ncbi:MAG: hypothetical protein JST40_14175 [Armatimonadetes bacterium]|nr:hypothetical protein [Armatimonadota bacterium]
MAKTLELKPEEVIARQYADRLILGSLTEIHSAVKLSELAEKLQADGIGLAAIRSLLASNPHRFSYVDRRWVPASRVESEGRPLNWILFTTVDRFGGPMPLSLLIKEVASIKEEDEESVAETVLRMIERDPNLFLTDDNAVALRTWVFSAIDESVERALAMEGVTMDEVDAINKKLGDKFDWRADNAIEKALSVTAPVNVRALGAAAWLVLNPQVSHAALLYNWKSFNAKLLALPGFVYGAEGVITSEADAKKWISTAVKLAERIAPSVEIDDSAPIEVKAEDVERMAGKIRSGDATVTATKLLEENYEITPSVKTFPYDLENLVNALKAQAGLWWVGGDRFRSENSAPDFVESIPEIFQFAYSDQVDEEGELVDVELTDEGLSTTLRKLLNHPLATDVLDEDIMPAPKQVPDSLRLVLKPIHRELGTFPMCQFPTGFISGSPKLQELIFVDPSGKEMQVWANLEARLLFGLFNFLEQPVESGAVFSVTKTPKPNVFDFEWLDQHDPVVFITSQRMEELRDIQARSEGMSTFEILQEVMTHHPKGADFLTILWEVNVVRRSTRRLVASLLSSYHCFYQRSGSPVWHYDAKKVEQGFDKTKRKFVIKR